MPNLKRNIANYFAALIVISTLAAIYTSVAQDLLQTPEYAAITPRPPTEDAHLKSSLADLFPEDAWQRGNCMRLLTRTGALLFKEWEQKSEDQCVLRPVTIISGRGMSLDGAESPVVLTANEGAEVQFAKKLDIMSGSASPIKMGRMIGDVTIDRVNDTAKNQAMRITTRNVRITNKQIWTTEEIKMNLGSAQLRGRDLTISLAASATTAASSETPSSLLDRLTLVYLDELVIPLDDLPDSKRKSRNTTPRSPEPIGQPAKTDDSRGVVKITAKGSVGYDFALDQLSMRKEVLMQRFAADRPNATTVSPYTNLPNGVQNVVLDEFKCDALDLSLRNPADRSVKRAHALDWIDRVHATGSPASLSISSQQLALSADEIKFNGLDGLLETSGSNGVLISRGDLHARFKKLTYQYNPAFPEVIGSIDAEGFGRVTVENKDAPVRQVTWTNGFRLQPVGNATLDEIESKQVQNELMLNVYGNIEATLADGNFHAGEIQAKLKPVWTEVPAGTRESSLTERGALQPPTIKTERKLSFVPDFFSARNAVSLVSNLAEAQTNELLLYFEQGADLLPNSAGEERSSNQSLLSSVLQPIGSQPGDSAGREKSALHSPVARSRPVLRGDQIAAELLITSSGIQAKDLSIKQNVHVTHQINFGASSMPIELVGQTMRLQQSTLEQGGGQDYLQIGSGPESPAKLMMGDGFFIGPKIEVWPRENFVQVAGVGELKVPTELLSKPGPIASDAPDNSFPASDYSASEYSASDTAPVQKSTRNLASKIDWTMPPYCRWNGGMQFDGKTAVLSGGVNIEAKFTSNSLPWVASINGDEMAIELSNPIELGDSSSFRTSTLAKISVAQLGENPVTVLAEQYQNDGSPQGRHLLSANQLTFLPDDGGKIWGTGPGWYRGWILNERSSSLLSNKSRPDRDVTHPVLQGVHLTFRETLQGDLEQQTLKFTGGVRAGGRPLERWDDEVDVTQMQRLDTDEMTLDCGELQFGITPGMPADLRAIPGMPTPWEMSATGGIVVRLQQESGLIEGQADRASFESKKSNLVIYGAANESAAVRKTSPDGRPGHIMRFPQASLNLKTYEFQGQVEDARLENLPIPGGR